MCEFYWEPEDLDRPGHCPRCDQSGAIAERCESCPVVEIEYRRSTTASGHLLERVLEHEFDAKHYRVDPGTVTIEIREGLKILEQERGKWEQETRERQRQEFDERQRVKELQRRQIQGGGGF